MRRDWGDRVRRGGSPSSVLAVATAPRPGPQPDILARKRFQKGARRGDMVPLADVVALLDQRNLPPQLRQTLYARYQVPANTPVKILEENSNRMSFIVFTPTGAAGTCFYSYGYPVKGDDGLYFGVPISVDGPGSQGESNGTVSIDAIWVFFNSGAARTFGAYEGTLAIESHLHNQTKNIGV